MRSCVAALLVLAAIVGHATALIETLKISKDDRHAFHIDSFGFEANGQFEIDLPEFQLLAPPGYQPPQTFSVAFVLQHSSSDSSVRIEDTCFHKTQINPEDTIIELPPKTVVGENALQFKKVIDKPGYYHLFFSNCEEGTQASFKLILTEYNNAEDGIRSYLSAGEASLPTWFLVLSVAFFIETAVWVVTLRKNAENIRNIHHLMTVVVVLKALSLFFEAMKYHSLKGDGVADGWSIVYFIFAFLKGMMMFTAIVLIGTGWSYLKPFLTERDKQMMLVILVVQFMFNVAALVLQETTPGEAGWVTWHDLLTLLDMVCCFLTLLPIMWSISHLREAAEVDGKAARNIVRLKRFRTFYLLVVGYVYFTRIVVFLVEALLPFELTWAGNVISELGTLAFYGITGWLFRPQPQNPYLALDTEEGSTTAMLPSADVEL